MHVVEKLRLQVKQYGVSLVETLVALALGLAMVSAAFNLYVSNRSVFRQIEAMIRLQESASIATALLETDIRHAAGTLCRNDAPMTPLLASTSPYWESNYSIDSGFYGIHGYDSTDTDPIVGTLRIAGDSISVTSDNMGASTRVIAPATSASSQNGLVGSYIFKVDNGTDFPVGTVALACDYERSVLFQVTASASSTVRLDTVGIGKVSPGNCGVLMRASGKGIDALYGDSACSGQQWRYLGGAMYNFGPGSMIGEHTFHHWYIGRNSSGGSSLFRKRMDYDSNGNVQLGDSEEMVENVIDMDITYLQGLLYTGYPFSQFYKTATQLRSSSNYTFRSVSAVRVVLTLMSPDKVGLTATNAASAAFYRIPINVAIRARMPGVVRR